MSKPGRAGSSGMIEIATSLYVPFGVTQKSCAVKSSVAVAMLNVLELGETVK